MEVTNEIRVDRIEEVELREFRLPIVFRFEDIIYKDILKGVTASVKPSEILAILGPPGSGKTTLMNIIAGRLIGYTGSVTYNNILHKPDLKRRIGFLAHDDVLIPQLTVEETLVFAALLRLPNTMSQPQKYERVEIIIKDLGLERIRDMKVGGGLVKGISEADRKLTSIGSEILVDPSVLLLEEPIAGLDFASANQLMQALHGVVQAGTAIITTIHQLPSNQVFHTFTKVLLISEGYPLYIGLTQNVMDYFSGLGITPQTPMNPGELMLGLASGQGDGINFPRGIALTSLEYEKAIVEHLHTQYKAILEPQEKSANHDRHADQDNVNLDLVIRASKEWNVSRWEEYGILWRRTFQERSAEYFNIIRFTQAGISALLLGLLWLNSNALSEQYLRDQVGLIFFICIFWTSSAMLESIYVFMFEKTHLLKERKSGSIRLSTYFMCCTLWDMITHVVYPILFLSITYSMSGLQMSVQCFAWTLLAILLQTINARGWANY